MLRRIGPALAAATLLLAACGGAGPAVTDPREIVADGLAATAELETVHLELALDGTATVPDLGGAMDLSGVSFAGDLDLENEEAHFTFAVPMLLGLTGEVIQVGEETYMKTSMTGQLWSKSTVDGDDPVADAMDPAEVLEQVRSFLDEEGVELQKLDDVECETGTCYAVRLTIPAELLADAGDVADVDTDELLADGLVLDMLFDRDEGWLTEVSTELSEESVGELQLTLSLSGFNDDVSIEAPPADQVTDEPANPFGF